MMKDDVKSGKMDKLYFSVLHEIVIDELKEEIQNEQYSIERHQNDLFTLRELEKIYKEIYDKGMNNKLEKKLARYELPAGYDMSINANLLSSKKKTIERDIALREFAMKELNLISKI